VSQHTYSFQYVACDIPPGMTIAEWKREKARAAAETAAACRHPLLRLRDPLGRRRRRGRDLVAHRRAVERGLDSPGRAAVQAA
jgi:hypothetical protein